MFSVDSISYEWSDYGFREINLAWNGKPVQWKAIERNGELVHVASRKYKLLPNEVALKAADIVAGRIGAEKIKVYMDPAGTMYAFYDLKEEVEPIKGVGTRLGVYVYNSVNGTLAFGASVLSILSKGGKTFCSVMPHKFLTTYLSPDVAVAIVREPHREGLDTNVEKIADKIRKLVERGREAIAIYRLWAEISLDKDIAEVLCDRLPKAYLPGYVKVLKNGVTLTELITVWDAYVDISSKIWLGSSSRTQATIDRKIELYKMLHNALPTPKKP